MGNECCCGCEPVAEGQHTPEWPYECWEFYRVEAPNTKLPNYGRSYAHIAYLGVDSEPRFLARQLFFSDRDYPVLDGIKKGFNYRSHWGVWNRSGESMSCPGANTILQPSTYLQSSSNPKPVGTASLKKINHDILDQGYESTGLDDGWHSYSSNQHDYDQGIRGESGVIFVRADGGSGYRLGHNSDRSFITTTTQQMTIYDNGYQGAMGIVGFGYWSFGPYFALGKYLLTTATKQTQIDITPQSEDIVRIDTKLVCNIVAGQDVTSRQHSCFINDEPVATVLDSLPFQIPYTGTEIPQLHGVVTSVVSGEGAFSDYKVKTKLGISDDD